MLFHTQVSEVEDIIAGVDAKLRQLHPGAGYIIRDLLPKDLGLTNEQWTLVLASITADQYNDYISKALDDEIAVGIVGVLFNETAANTATTQIKISRGKTDIALIPVEDAVDFADQGHAWFDQAYVIPGDVTVDIQLWCDNGAADESVGFLGRIIEKRDKNINPSKDIPTFRGAAPVPEAATAGGA